MSYQSALRALGQWVDERNPRRITVVEEPDGFMLEWTWGSARAMYARHFTHDEVLSMQRHGRQKRAFTSTANARRQAESTGRRNYQEVLRALGFEMDQASAYALLIDELDDGVLVTYQYRGSGERHVWHKHMGLLLTTAVDHLLVQGRARRQPKTGLAARLG